MKFKLRQSKMSFKIKKAISDIIFYNCRNKIIKNILITKTEISKDMCHFSIFFVQKNKENNLTMTLNTLNKSIGFFKSELSKNLCLKKIPHLKFLFDKYYLMSNNISAIIENLKK